MAESKTTSEIKITPDQIKKSGSDFEQLASSITDISTELERATESVGSWQGLSGDAFRDMMDKANRAIDVKLSHSYGSDDADQFYAKDNSIPVGSNTNTKVKVTSGPSGSSYSKKTQSSHASNFSSADKLSKLTN